MMIAAIASAAILSVMAVAAHAENALPLIYGAKICNPRDATCRYFAKFTVLDDCRYLIEWRTEIEVKKSEEWKKAGRDSPPFTFFCEKLTD